MSKLIKNITIYHEEQLLDVQRIMAELSILLDSQKKYVLFPGFCDVHVHFREPGFSYKETIKTGSSAAAKGGYTAVCTMPNLKPVPDCLENLQKELKIIESDSIIRIYPYGAITVGQKGEQLANLEEMSKYVIAFSDDGHGVQKPEMMREAMIRAKKLDKLIVAHCEDNSLLKDGYIHEGMYAKEHRHKGICSKSEWGPIQRDIELVREIGCAYHVCHISTKESVDLIRKAKADGVNITCETAPHYLVLDENDLKEDGKFKMNPPLRSKEDREALIEGIKDGTIDMIATDHAPHSQEEKAKGLKDSAFGIVGLETAFPVLYTKLVKNGIITLEKLIELLAINPRKRFNIEFANEYSVWDLNAKEIVNPETFKTKGRATPFEGMELYGKCKLTKAKDETIYSYDEIKTEEN